MKFQVIVTVTIVDPDTGKALCESGTDTLTLAPAVDDAEAKDYMREELSTLVRAASANIENCFEGEPE